jgi:hypothetical protein
MVIPWSHQMPPLSAAGGVAVGWDWADPVVGSVVADELADLGRMPLL